MDFRGSLGIQNTGRIGRERWRGTNDENTILMYEILKKKFKNQVYEELIHAASHWTGYMFGVLAAPKLCLQNPVIVNIFLEVSRMYFQ